MKTYEIECYEVTEPDGGGMHSVHLCYTSTKAVADEIIKSLGTGWPRTTTKYTKLITVVESLEEYQANTKAALLRSAASKLTAEERALLGLTKDGTRA